MPSWPDAVSDAVAEVVGRPGSRTALGGLSGSAVERVDGPRGAVVVKRAVAREVAFYADVAPSLPAAVRVPSAWWARDGWLVLEHVPAPLPRGRWTADPDVLALLAALHRAEPPALGDPFVPAWPDDLTAPALARLPASARPALDHAREVALATWAGPSLVSGDTNPRNWALRPDGTVVLLDWERVGFASPAVDLAATVPGLGAPDDFAAVSTGYERAAGTNVPVEALVAVKAWTAVELLARPPTAALAPVQDHLVDALPSWLATW
ncbi:hypothetical protein GCM10028777_03660 [Angustibacter speluncae]